MDRTDGGRDVGVVADSEISIASLSETEQKEQRALVIGEYCDLIEQYPCLDWAATIPGLPSKESIEEQIEYCKAYTELQHYVFSFPDCNQQWEALFRCYVRHDWSCPCDAKQGDCAVPGADTDFLNSELCSQERIAYDSCDSSIGHESYFDIAGERATCTGYIRANDSGNCIIQCDVSPDYFFWVDCEGPADGPVRCRCSLNRDILDDILADTYYAIYAPDCREATQAVADGKCMDIINCCISWKDRNDYEVCGCTADPTRPYLGIETGATTCQQLADLVEGEVVDLCPQHAPINWEADESFPLF